jgi:hypothetical protein
MFLQTQRRETLLVGVEEETMFHGNRTVTLDKTGQERKEENRTVLDRT